MRAAGTDRFQQMGIVHISTHSMEQMLACLDVIMGGVMERFPRLRFAFLEAQCGWLPFWLHRMDEHHEWREPYGEMTHLTMPPSEYFRRQGFCAVECDEEFVKHVVDAFGDDNLVTTTDYPHGDSKYPGAMDRFLTLPISDASKQKILWDNVLRLYAPVAPGEPRVHRRRQHRPAHGGPAPARRPPAHRSRRPPRERGAPARRRGAVGRLARRRRRRLRSGGHLPARADGNGAGGPGPQGDPRGHPARRPLPRPHHQLPAARAPRPRRAPGAAASTCSTPR